MPIDSPAHTRVSGSHLAPQRPPLQSLALRRAGYREAGERLLRHRPPKGCACRAPSRSCRAGRPQAGGPREGSEASHLILFLAAPHQQILEIRPGHERVDDVKAKPRSGLQPYGAQVGIC